MFFFFSSKATDPANGTVAFLSSQMSEMAVFKIYNYNDINVVPILKPNVNGYETAENVVNGNEVNENQASENKKDKS